MKEIIVISPSEFPGKSGDSANYTEIMNQLSKEGFKVTLICPKEDANLPNQLSKDIEINRIPIQPPRLKNLKNGPRFLDWIKLVLFLLAEIIVVYRTVSKKKIKQALVRHHILTLPIPWLIRRMKLRAIADAMVISDSHEAAISESMLNRIKEFEKRNISSYRHFIVHTNREKKSLIEMGFPEKFVKIIPVSINLEKIPHYRISEIPKNTFGYFGILEKSRRVDMLLEAFKIVLKKIPEAKLYIIGDGSHKKELQDKTIKDEISDNVEFTSVSREKLWNEYFKKFRVLVDPNPDVEKDPQDINMSIKLIEALAAGKPIIRMGLAEKNNGLKGMINVPPNDPDILAKEMILLSDTQLCEEISANAKSYSKNFDICKRIKEIINAFG